MDFRKTVIDSLDRILAGELVERTVEKMLEKTIASVIEDQLRAYSDFGKALEAKFKEALALPDGSLDIPPYTDMIIKITRTLAQKYANDMITQQVTKRMEELLEPPPAEIKLSELVERFRKEVEERHRGECVCYGEVGEITFRCEAGSITGFTDVELDGQPNGKKYGCDIRFGIHRDHLYHLQFKNRDIEREMFVSDLYGFERLLFQMKAAKTKVIVDDCSRVELSYEMPGD